MKRLTFIYEWPIVLVRSYADLSRRVRLIEKLEVLRCTTKKERKMKVYGGLTFLKGKQVRTIVAAKSMKQAAELTGEKYSYFREYWSETRNEIELHVANSQPGVVFKASSSMGHDFTPSTAGSNGPSA